MGKKMVSILLAGSICLGAAGSVWNSTETVSALTITAHVTNVSVIKDCIAVGESIQLQLEWSTGAKQEVSYASSDETVALVDQTGLVTGIAGGTAEISVTMPSTGLTKTVTITVAEDVRKSEYYNTSELELGMMLYQYDTLHYLNDNIGSGICYVDEKGEFAHETLIIEDYVMPFDAEVVGIDGLTVYLAVAQENVTYIDCRTLSEGDVIDRTAHLLGYNYRHNDGVLTIFPPSWYDIFGEGVIRVKTADHENKTLLLEAVPEGDANADGTFTITDVVMMQKWIAGVQSTAPACWDAADLCADGRIDAFDLAVMKRRLLDTI